MPALVPGDHGGAVRALEFTEALVSFPSATEWPQSPPRMASAITGNYHRKYPAIPGATHPTKQLHNEKIYLPSVINMRLWARIGVRSDLVQKSSAPPSRSLPVSLSPDTRPSSGSSLPARNSDSPRSASPCSS